MANKWDAVVGTEEYGRTLARASEFAEIMGFTLNGDTERIEKVIGLMTMNCIEAGDYYCPCKQTHPLDTGKDVICPCPEAAAEVRTDGCCFCRLFFS